MAKPSSRRRPKSKVTGSTPLTVSTPLTAGGVPALIKTTIKVDRALWGQVYARALADGADMNRVVTYALRAYLRAK